MLSSNRKLLVGIDYNRKDFVCFDVPAEEPRSPRQLFKALGSFANCFAVVYESKVIASGVPPYGPQNIPTPGEGILAIKAWMAAPIGGPSSLPSFASVFPNGTVTLNCDPNWIPGTVTP